MYIYMEATIGQDTSGSHEENMGNTASTPVTLFPPPA